MEWAIHTHEPVIESHQIASLGEFVGTVLSIVRRWAPNDKYPDLWYRGINDATLDLLPAAYWRSNCDEYSLALYFRSLTPSLLHHEPTDEWEWYYAMRHYGLPTRLLDWSESPLVALYFALEEDEEGKDAIVWVLNPLDLNSLTDKTGSSAIFCPFQGKPTEKWLPDHCGKDKAIFTFDGDETTEVHLRDNSKPIAIYPKRFNPRIVAQRGVFTVHGVDQTPINMLPLDSSDGIPSLARLVIPACCKPAIWCDLFRFGMNRSSVYPEPQSVASDLMRAFNLEAR